MKISESVNRVRASRMLAEFALLACVLLAVGCGGDASNSTALPSALPSQITSIVVSPTPVAVYIGASHSFTAEVSGTGTFDHKVTWSANDVVGGNTTFGTITSGHYTAPAVPPNPNSVTVTATSVQDPSTFGSSGAIIFAPAILQSIAPSATVAGAQITITGQSLVGPTPFTFTRINGTSISMPVLQQLSPTQINSQSVRAA